MKPANEIQQLKEFAHEIDKSVAILIENQKGYRQDLLNSKLEYENKYLELKKEFSEKNLELDARLKVIEEERQQELGAKNFKKTVFKLWPIWLFIVGALSFLRFHEFINQFFKI